MPALTASRATLAKNWLSVARETRGVRLTLEKAKTAGDKNTVKANKKYCKEKISTHGKHESLVLPTLHLLEHDEKRAAYSAHMLGKHTQVAFGTINAIANPRFTSVFEKFKEASITSLRHNELCSTAFARRLNGNAVMKNRVDAKDLLQQAANALKIIRTIEPEVECDKRARFIKTDPALFYQMVFDGLENARKAVEAKYGPGNDGLDKKRIKLKASLTPTGEFKVEIEDNGIGVSEEQIENGKSCWPVGLFPEDTGFGAKTIRENLSQLGGEKRIQGKPDGGAVLTLTLPQKRRLAA